MKPHFLTWNLGGDSEDWVDERDLSYPIMAIDSRNLPFSDHDLQFFVGRYH
ncbi:hypothetical protein [Leptolyngbya sp. CCY15150]|uniref:hypothetical protein n=1 Tax=Leptolyngbya sp. CCY15150 TaxID=2767772 RepID=UPI00194FF180|nr:hypothetical protein [Leptolyngbya sp. CCY15150]